MYTSWNIFLGSNVLDLIRVLMNTATSLTYLDCICGFGLSSSQFSMHFCKYMLRNASGNLMELDNLFTTSKLYKEIFIWMRHSKYSWMLRPHWLMRANRKLDKSGLYSISRGNFCGVSPLSITHF